MKHYLCEDLQNGELFLVGEENRARAAALASSYFEEFRIIRQVSEIEAENSGLDEY